MFFADAIPIPPLILREKSTQETTIAIDTTNKKENTH